MKKLLVCFVVGLVMFLGAGGVMPASIGGTAIAIRHAAIGAANTAVLQGPNGLYLLASKVSPINWVFVCVNGSCEVAIADFIARAGGNGNMVNIATWAKLETDLMANGWQSISASALPANIRDIAAKTAPWEYFRIFMQWVAGFGGALGAAKKVRG